MHRDSFEALRKTARETSDHFKNVLNPTLVGLGISAITVGGAIAGLAKGIKDLGAYGKEMSFASHETGLAINSLNAWIEAGKRANITSEAMIGSLTSTNEKLSQFEKRRDSALQQFFAVNNDKPVMAKLEHDLRAAAGDREKQDRLILETYGKLQEADQHLLEEAFGEQNFRRFNSKDIDENAKKLHQFTDQQIEDLKNQQKAFEDTAAAAKKLATEMELSFSKPMKEASDAVGEFIDKHGKDMKDFLAEVVVDLKSADWEDFAQGIGKAATEAKKFVDTFGGIEALEGLAALKYGGVAGLAAFGAFKALQPSPLNKGEDELERKLGMPQPPTVDLHGAAPSVLDKNPTGGGFHFFKDKPSSIWEYETPSAEKMSYRGRIPDIQKPGMDGLQRAAYKTGEETPGAEIRAEAVMTRATMRGTAEGSRIGVLAAFHEWEDEKRRGGGIQTAAYNPGEGTGAGGGLGGGYGGLGGGAGGGLGGAPGGGSGAGGESPASVAPMKGPHGHPGQHAILGGHVKEAAATIKAAKAAMPAGGAEPGPPGDAPSGEGKFSFMHGQFGAHGDMAHIHQYKTASGRRIMLNDESAKHMVPFLNEMEKMGMPFTRKSGSYDSFNDRPIRGGSTWSQHAYGNAVDLEATGFNPTKEMGEWQQKNIAPMREAMDRWGIKWGGDMRRRDTPHFEWGGTEGTHAPEVSAGGARPPEVTTPPTGTTKPDLTNNPGDLHWPGTWLSKHPEYGATRSTSGDQGAPLAQFPSMKAGLDAMQGLIEQKYIKESRKTANQLIAAKGGWTPGALGRDAAKNIARDMGIGPDDDLGLGDPKKMLAFKRALAKQEGSKEGVEALKDAMRPADGRAATRAIFGHPHQQRPDLLGNARKAGHYQEPQQHKVRGDASLNINLRGFPKGTHTQTKMSGMFSQIRVARGRAMPLANQDS